jgi:hypothetical protein
MNIRTIEPEEEEVSNVVELQLLQGGKSGGDNNWLGNLPIGSNFLVKKRNSKDFQLGIFCLAFKWTKAAHLVIITNGSETELYVDQKQFSKEFELFELLGRTILNDEDTT